MRGVVEALVRVVGGEQTLARMRIEPAPTKAPAYDPAACAQVLLDGQSLGFYALLDKAAQAHFDLSAPVVVGELDLEQLLALYPPRSRVYLPPSFPAIERDVSLVVDEGLRYAAILEALDKHKVPPIEDVRLVTIYRGKPLAAGTKSVTVRLSCRDASRTLTHDEVDAPVGALLGGLRKEFSYELRT